MKYEVKKPIPCEERNENTIIWRSIEEENSIMKMKYEEEWNDKKLLLLESIMWRNIKQYVSEINEIYDEVMIMIMKRNDERKVLLT